MKLRRALGRFILLLFGAGVATYGGKQGEPPAQFQTEPEHPNPRTRHPGLASPPRPGLPEASVPKPCWLTTRLT